MENDTTDVIPIVIFAKVPLPGYAKTRLIPALGEDGAARIARQLLQHTVQTAVLADLGPVIVSAAPDKSHPLWEELNLPASLQWRDQGEGDLGERLSRAAESALSAYRRVLIIGTDCPELTTEFLQAAAERLLQHDACMIPAADGGYALIGLRRYHESLFIDIPWSTSDVAAITVDRCTELGWSLAELTTLHDIDNPDDLQWLKELDKFSPTPFS
jgi:rSAM/selenodomain-associated transferase 1